MNRWPRAELRLLLLAAFASLLLPPLIGGDTILDRSPALKHPGMLGTGSYKPLPAEVPFFEKIPTQERQTVSGYGDEERAFYESDFFKLNNPKSTPESLAADEPVFSLMGHIGEYVSWFGILRRVEQVGTEYRMTIQNKYSTGMSDLHIQTVSIRGAGDFEAVVRRPTLDLLPLVLVKVYGKVVREESDRPVIEVEYIRYWNWLYFNFMDYGKDKGLTAFDKDLDLSGIRVYSRQVSPGYYSKRIQATDEQLAQIRKWIDENWDSIDKEYKDAQVAEP